MVNRPFPLLSRELDGYFSVCYSCSVVVVFMLEDGVGDTQNVGAVSLHSIGMVSLYSIGVESLYRIGVVSLYSIGVVSLYSIGVVSLYSKRCRKLV